MRMLHDVRPEETLICQGQYQYLIDDQPTGEVESWQITQLPNGVEVVRSDIDGLATSDRSNLLIHLQRKQNGQADWLRLQYVKDEWYAAAQYTFDKALIRTARRAEEQPVRQEVLDIATGYQIDYHCVIGHDYVWRGYPRHARGQPWAIPVFSPNLWAEGEDVLKGRALRFRVKPLATETCVTPAGSFEDTRHFEITLSDGVKAEAWFDDAGIPLRWTYPEKGYDFVLMAYIREAL